MNKTNEEKIEVGNDILSYCGKCKVDSTHIISAMEKDKLSKVTCRTCNAIHNYRKPKSLIESKTAKKPLKRTKTTSSRKGPKNASEKWTDLLANYDVNEAQAYKVRQSYEESSIIRHPSFGLGIVTKKINQKKIEVQFEVGVKLLIINKK